ncbi:hypothetical protein F1643_19345 [Azospirillum sp. INR13]|uniref:hypothetical protein n=1 Tax=Azospirillum sp. INR13 TaxID=2596919 RepID=UPI001892386B|nr:hypothetical protein [Azospirillum sp. INR13]MBF5096204.1 hypothetical protein [Azospirillum sp. INR13]
MSLSAHYIVSCRTDGWFVGLEGERYGPFPNGQVGALIAAVQAANHAGKDGHDARVLLRTAKGVTATVWVFGTDSYPSPWVEDLHRIALLPSRERARASVPPPPFRGLAATTPNAALAGLG